MKKKILPGSAKRREAKKRIEQEALWIAQQERKLESGEEIPPPWISFPDADPTALWISWRYGNHWLDNIWKPFWQRKTETERQEYLEQWPPPTDEWRETITVYWK